MFQNTWITASAVGCDGVGWCLWRRCAESVWRRRSGRKRRRAATTFAGAAGPVIWRWRSPTAAPTTSPVRPSAVPCWYRTHRAHLFWEPERERERELETRTWMVRSSQELSTSFWKASMMSREEPNSFWMSFSASMATLFLFQSCPICSSISNPLKGKGLSVPFSLRCWGYLTMSYIIIAPC